MREFHIIITAQCTFQRTVRPGVLRQTIRTATRNYVRAYAETTTELDIYNQVLAEIITELGFDYDQTTVIFYRCTPNKPHMVM